MTENAVERLPEPDTHGLTVALRDFEPAEYDWNFCFYRSSKNRDGVNLDFFEVEMAGIADFTDTIRQGLLEKTLQEKTVVPHNPLIPSETVGGLHRRDPLIREALQVVLAGTASALPQAAENFALGLCPPPTGYLFTGRKTEEDGTQKQVVFMKRGNPFVKAGKNRICTAADDVSLAERPVLKFTPTVDFLLMEDFAYFFSASVEKDFGFESRHAAMAEKRLRALAEAELVNNFEQLEAAAYSAKNARKFADFDSEILNHIRRLEREAREDFLNAHGVTLDSEGKIATDDPESCELLIDLLCQRSCHDAFGRLAKATKIVPR